MPTVTPVQVVHLVVQVLRATLEARVLMASWETRVPTVTQVQVRLRVVLVLRAMQAARVLMAL